MSLLIAKAQNVGIGTGNPTQKLDVNGNVNVTGNLLTAGVLGTNGQVLTMNGSSMQWMDKSRFKNWAIYPTPTIAGGTISFTVPPGVTEIMIEMWGAGGGAHLQGGGGGSGGYWIGLMPVTSGFNILLTIGSGGSSGFGITAGGPGGNTGFSFTGFNVFTGGGGGADSSIISGGNNILTNIAGDGGVGMVSGATIPSTFRTYYFSQGSNGSPSNTSFIQTGSTTFGQLFIGGIGGVAPFSGHDPDHPCTSLSVPGTEYRGSNSNSAVVEFGSGGSLRAINGGGGLAHGGPGRVIIYY